jgi:predicted lipid carrier protein YhbT
MDKFFFETRLLCIDGNIRNMLAISNILELPQNVQVDAMLRSRCG